MNRKAKGSGFKMKGNPIKSIVEQTRTQADQSLVEAGRRLGDSKVPQAIDYSLGGLNSLNYGESDIDNDDGDRTPTEKIKRLKPKNLKVTKGKGPDLKKRKYKRKSSGGSAKSKTKKDKKTSVSVDLDYYNKSAKIQKDEKTTTIASSDKKTKKNKKTTKKNKPAVSAWLSKLFKSKNA